MDPRLVRRGVTCARTAHRLVPGRDPASLEHRVRRTRNQERTLGPSLRRRRRRSQIRNVRTASPRYPRRGRSPRLYAKGKGSERRLRSRRATGLGGPHGSPKKSSILIDTPRSRNNPRPAARVRTKSGRMPSPRRLPPSPAGPPNAVNAVDSRLRVNDGCGGLPRARVPNAIPRKRIRHHPEDLKPDGYDIASAMMRS